MQSVKQATLEKLLIIVDGNSFAHRAYHAIPPLTTKDGHPTNILTGVTNMLNNLEKEFSPTKMVVAFDAKGKNFRHEMFSDYKGTRKPTPDDFKIQMQPLKDIIDAWGYPMMSISGVEADDSISTMALRAVEEGFRVIIATSDKDMCQIVNENILILDTKDIEKKKTPLDPNGVKEKMGVYPDKIIDLLALMGDNADNVPGIEGCGPKKAIGLLEEYGSVEGVKANAHNIKGKFGEKVRSAIENDLLDLSYKLVTIKTDVDLGQKVEEFIGKKDDEKLFHLLTRFNMLGLRKKLELKDPNAEIIETTVETNIEKVKEYFSTSLFKASKINIETFEFEDKKHFIIEEFNNDKKYLFKEENKCDLAKLIRLLSSNHEATIISVDAKKVLRNLYFVTGEIAVFDIKVDDARIFDYVKNGGSSKLVTVEYLNDTFVKVELNPLRDKYKLDSTKPKLDKMSLEELIDVKAEELEIAKKVVSEKTDEEKEYCKKENKMLQVLAYMESMGATIDKEGLEKFGVELDAMLSEQKELVTSLTGLPDLNINSPKQVETALYDNLEIETKKRSTSEDQLLKNIELINKKIEKDEEVDKAMLNNQILAINAILKYRSLSKLKSTYVEGLLTRLTNENKVHTTFNSTITTTGRLSSNDPNLQNIPIKSEEGKRIRKSFVARKGFKIVALDYSQIELRILAHMANETTLINAFNSGKDIHSSTAADILNIDINDVQSEQRRIAKAINFGLIYGMKEKRLAEELNIEKKEASKYYKGYFKTYPEIKPYFEKELELAKENLFVKTLNGRKISAQELTSKNSFIKSHAEKSASNAKIQGTASDIIKDAMLEIFKYKINGKLQGELLIQVHDELLFEVPEEKAKETAELVKSIMENIVSLKVPLIVEYGIGDNWLEAH